ncbi:aminotransferase class I/II-fold pyridoxal phosphate-dependent enzyme [uncultured Draconibacterium sp.]|uniref:aminotransferase class I/II-fold pyridoxal phosphate-dependent enzyme n=1 Tax=uncultured Draconibacterium sp. TaxID=1573823 RepID=UPI0032162AEC
MNIAPFELERYFAKYEFSTKYLLSCSDCEPLHLQELLKMADTETLKLWNNLKLAYTESSGHPLLKEEIAKLYTTIIPDELNVMVPEEAIFIAMNCILEKGDHVVASFPGYQSLYEIANAMGCEISKWQPNFTNGWKFDVEKLKSLLRPNTKLLVINFPHNPSGATVSKAEFYEIIELCRQNNTLLFSDEMYRFLEYSADNRLPSASDLYENAISLFGMSKSFALPGLRIGWLSSKNKKLMNKIGAFKDYTTICNNAPGEILSIIALQNKHKILDRNLKLISENLQLLDSFFANYKNLFEWHKPLAGPISFPKLTTNIHIDEFCKILVTEYETMLLPSSVYGFQGNFFRIGFARKDLNEGLIQLENFVNRHTFD